MTENNRPTNQMPPLPGQQSAAGQQPPVPAPPAYQPPAPPAPPAQQGWQQPGQQQGWQQPGQQQGWQQPGAQQQSWQQPGGQQQGYQQPGGQQQSWQQPGGQQQGYQQPGGQQQSWQQPGGQQQGYQQPGGQQTYQAKAPTWDELKATGNYQIPPEYPAATFNPESFSIPAFLIAPIWYMVKGMWQKGLVLFAAGFLLSFFGFGILGIAVGIYAGLYGHRDYLRFYNSKVQFWF